MLNCYSILNINIAMIMQLFKVPLCRIYGNQLVEMENSMNYKSLCFCYHKPLYQHREWVLEGRHVPHYRKIARELLYYCSHVISSDSRKKKGWKDNKEEGRKGISVLWCWLSTRKNKGVSAETWQTHTKNERGKRGAMSWLNFIQYSEPLTCHIIPLFLLCNEAQSS